MFDGFEHGGSGRSGHATILAADARRHHSAAGISGGQAEPHRRSHRVGAHLSGRTLDIARTRGAIGGLRRYSDPARRGLEAFARPAVARVTENFR
jgi:hypothetical protein